MKRLLLILLTAAAAASCRPVVLEDRTQCPSFLFFDLADADLFPPYAEVLATVYAHPEGRQTDEARTSVSAIAGRLFFFTVRGTAAVTGYGLMGYEGLSRDGSVWRVPLGKDYVPLFRFGYMSPVEEESFTVPVEMTKEHSRVTVQFLGAETFGHSEGRFPFDVTVRGGTSGIDALSGVPVRGPFEVRPTETGIGHFEFILPRQADKDLVLEMYAREGLYEYEGFQATYNLYELLSEKGGITWTEKNLPDLHIEIDYEQTTVNVGVFPWGEQELEYGL